ncbi:MAG: hypothetical protein P8Y94_07305, partial [Acidobacteriota bacterium]
MAQESTCRAFSRIAVLQALIFLLICGMALAGDFSNGVYENALFGGQVTLRFQFQSGEAIPFGIEEKTETHSGYQYPYTYFLIPPGESACIVGHTVSGAQVTVTRSNHQFDWSSRTLISDNPFRMITNRYYRFQIRAAGHPDQYLYFALKTAEPEEPHVEMTVTAAPSLDASSRNALIPADERFPAVFTIALWDTEPYPKVPYTEPQTLNISITDSTKGRLESSQGSGREISVTTDAQGQAEFRYVYLGTQPLQKPFTEWVGIHCPAFNLSDSRTVSVGLKPRIVDISKRWDSATAFPRKVGLRIEFQDEFHPDLDYLQYNTLLQTYLPESHRLGVFLDTEWLNAPKPGDFERLLEALGSIGYWFRPADAELFQGRGLFPEFKSRFLIKAIDAPWIDLEMRFPAHILHRSGTYWLSASLGLMREPEDTDDPVDLLEGSKGDTLIYALEAPEGGESVLQSIACAFQPTSSAQYWVKYLLTDDFFKLPLQAAGGPVAGVVFGTVKLFDKACDLLKGDYFKIMRDLALDYVKGLDKLKEGGKLTQREEQLLFYGVIANETKVMNDHFNNISRHLDELSNQDQRTLSRRIVRDTQSHVSPIIDIPPDLDLDELSSILNALSIDHNGPIEIDRFFASTPGSVTSSFYQVGVQQTPATTTLDTTPGPAAVAEVDLGSDGSVDEDVSAESQIHTPAADDGDGVPGDVEDQAPHNGDCNQDGIPDRTQSNVASLPNAVDGRYVTIVSPDRTELSGVQAFESVASGSTPESVDFPVGLFQFHVTGLETGGTTTVSMLLPEGVETNSYYRYGPTTTDSLNHWYSFGFDLETGAEIEDNTVRIHFKDGARGDDDPYPDGLIVDPGAPAQASRTHDLHFAQFATGGGLFSEMLLMNLDAAEEADVEVEFRGSKGETLSFPLGGDVVAGQTYLSIPPLGMRVLQTDDSEDVVLGSSHVHSTTDVAGVLIFGGSFGLAGVGNSASLDDGFLAPMQRQAATDINTGIAVANLESEDTTLHLRLLGTSGTELATSTELLDPNGQKAVFLHEFEWSPQMDLSDFQGLIEVTSSGRTAATVLQTRPGQYATMPVVPRSQIGSIADLNFAQFATGGGLFSEMTLLNLDQQNDAQLDIAFRNFEGDPLSFQLDNSLVQGSLQVSVPASGMR